MRDGLLDVPVQRTSPDRPVAASDRTQRGLGYHCSLNHVIRHQHFRHRSIVTSTDAWRETIYLLRSPANARRLMEAVARDKARNATAAKRTDELEALAADLARRSGGLDDDAADLQEGFG